MAVFITRGITSWDGDDHVYVRNAELINTLIQDKDAVIKFLSANVSPITLDKITIDEHGTVIITDPGFKAKVEAALSGPAGLVKNAGC